MTWQEIEQSIAAHDRQLDTIVKLLAEASEDISRLARIAESHERRLNDMEGGRA